MNLIMKEHLFVQNWVDKLTTEDPINHTPWASDPIGGERNYIAAGHIHAESAVISHKLRHLRRRKRRLGETNTRPRHEQAPNPPNKTKATNQRHVPTVHQRTGNRHLTMPRTSLKVIKRKAKEMNVPMNGIPFSSHHVPDPGIQTNAADRETQTDYFGQSIRFTTPPCRLLAGASTSQLEPPDLSLAGRRGKTVSGLQLKPYQIGDIEYPDIPTAFRGSPAPHLAAFDLDKNLGQCSMDHNSMLSSLRSKCASFTSGCTPTSEANTSWPILDIAGGGDVQIPPEPSSDNCTINANLVELGDINRLEDNVMDMENLLSMEVQDGSRIPYSSISFEPTSYSTPIAFMRDSPGPPDIPLPPRPVLINPSTPPSVRGILKKVKSVRFEDALESDDQDLLIVPIPYDPITPSLKRPSPLRQSHTPTNDARPCIPVLKEVSSKLPHTALPKIASRTASSILRSSIRENVKPTGQVVPTDQVVSHEENELKVEEEVVVREGPVANEMATSKQKSSPKEKVAVKQKMAPPKSIFKPKHFSEIPVLGSRDLNVEQKAKTGGNAVPASASLGRNSHIGSINVDKGSASKTRHNRWSTMTQTDLRSGLEMPSSQKSRLTTPLRNIFRFR
ncbi:hypothetical protein BJ138DRAFT_1145094 [Hygrophoropsis aurantiaca]|uniref:Uncharacterized protein n=1 Tax=Hygrophoropsis aurantiaca TaxID=72124 RepID=A0ACB8ALE5_9AGAM|nr:hypothetical protein BJ138DRAFT_1145094 [Hygrophoropsis aurantiaca]